MAANVATASSAEVPFRLAGGAQPLMLIPVFVNDGGPFEFIFDTGAGTTLLSATLAEPLHVNLTGSKQGHTAGGAIEVKVGSVESIAVGELVRENAPVAVTDLSPLERAVGAKIDGDLGHDFFGNCRVAIDYRRRVLRLDDPRRSEYCGPAPLTEVPAKLAAPAKPLIVIDAHVNGRGPFRFAVDTGTSTTAISTALARDLNLRLSAGPQITTGGAALQMETARLEALRIGACQIGELTVLVGGFLPMLSNVIGAQLDGIVGYDFLRNYKVVIDYPNDRLALFA